MPREKGLWPPAICEHFAVIIPSNRRGHPPSSPGQALCFTALFRRAHGTMRMRRLRHMWQCSHRDGGCTKHDYWQTSRFDAYMGIKKPCAKCWQSISRRKPP